MNTAAIIALSEQEIVEASKQVFGESDRVYGSKPCPICSGDHHLSEHIPAQLSPAAFTWIRETADSEERYRHYVIKQNQELKALRDENHTLRLERERLEGICSHLESYLTEVGDESREPF